jgi:2'-5' RNA ligase
LFYYPIMQLVLDLDGGREFRPRKAGRPPRYFFALLPDAGAEPQIHVLAQALHDRLRPSGRLRGLGKYHVTLRGIAAPDGPFGQSIAMARTVADAIRKTSFAVMFNQAASFGAAPNYAFSLTTRADLLAANGLSATLLDDLRRAGLKVDGSSFQPHVTLFYDKVLRTPIDMPEVSWQAREFVLVESIDRRPYQILGTWPLG